MFGFHILQRHLSFCSGRCVIFTEENPKRYYFSRVRNFLVDQNSFRLFHCHYWELHLHLADVYCNCFCRRECQGPCAKLPNQEVDLIYF